jgi:hypothetical protein
MAEFQPVAICPACGKDLPPAACACPACGEELRIDRAEEGDVTDRPRRPRRLEDDDDYAETRPRRRRDITNPDDEALSWIVPMRESLWAIAAGYLGLFSCFPILGLLPAVLAITFGIMALSDIKFHKGRRGAFRAWFGIVLGTLMFVVWIPTLIIMLINR